MAKSKLIIGLALTGAIGLAACGRGPETVDKDIQPPEVAESEEAVEAADAGMDRSQVEVSPENDPTSGERMEAHIHGSATLAAGLDGETLSITFEAPLMSMVGFEHEAETEEQTAALNALKDAFTTPGGMVEINSEAGCLPLMTTSGTHFANGHGALEVEHVYTCETPGEISEITFTQMGAYSSLETVDAVFVSDTSQVADELTPSNAVLQIR